MRCNGMRDSETKVYVHSLFPPVPASVEFTAAQPKKKAPKGLLQMLERVKGIEPSYEAWEAAVLPLNYTRIGHGL